jgi:hypothetical protein
MATPDEVRASLLASGDHGRDGCARRKLADQVKAVVMAATDGQGESAATAASGVVLASGLRAPANGPEPTTVARDETSALTDDQWMAIDPPVDVSRAVVEIGREADRLDVAHAFPRRQGWRARLANVERLLAASLDSKTPRQAAETVADALVSIRAMIDGDGE